MAMGRKPGLLLLSNLFKTLDHHHRHFSSSNSGNLSILGNHTAKWMQDTSKKSPMELINEVPPIKVEGRIVAAKETPILLSGIRSNSYALT